VSLFKVQILFFFNYGNNYSIIYYYNFYFYSNGFTLQEALDILFEADDEYQARVEEIYIESPDVNILTDEDGAGAMHNLTGR